MDKALPQHSQAFRSSGTEHCKSSRAQPDSNTANYLPRASFQKYINPLQYRLKNTGVPNQSGSHMWSLLLLKAPSEAAPFPHAQEKANNPLRYNEQKHLVLQIPSPFCSPTQPQTKWETGGSLSQSRNIRERCQHIIFHLRTKLTRESLW